jgi:hypothetical protein
MTEQKEPIKVVFCLPGDSYSNTFLVCWSELLNWCTHNGIRPYLTNAKTTNSYCARNQCLGGNVLKGENQKPFDGKLEYDYIMWIDSDQAFHPHQFEKLLKADKDIVAGLYLMEDGKQYATVEKRNQEHFLSNGTYEFLTPETAKDKEDLVEVDYTGMGFMLVKKGVFEALSYPWFKPIEYRFENSIVDFAMDDVSFCHLAKEKGFKVLVDPKVIVGHEKLFIF